MNQIAHKISQDLVVTELGHTTLYSGYCFKRTIIGTCVKQVLIGLEGIVTVRGASRSRTFPLQNTSKLLVTGCLLLSQLCVHSSKLFVVIKLDINGTDCTCRFAPMLWLHC